MKNETGCRFRPGIEHLEARDVPAFLAPVVSAGGGDSLAVADFNHDGRDDVAVISGTGSASVSLSKPDGTFNKPISLGGAKGPLLYLEAVDFNGDGHVDVVATAFSRKYVRRCSVYGDGCTLSGTRYQSVWLGEGNGTFGPVSIMSSPFSVWTGGYGGGSWPSTVYNPTGTSADFNHDGIIDYAELNKDLGTITVSLHRKARRCKHSPIRQAQVHAPSCGDFNGDGLADLVTVNSNKFSVRLNDGTW